MNLLDQNFQEISEDWEIASKKPAFAGNQEIFNDLPLDYFKHNAQLNQYGIELNPEFDIELLSNVVNQFSLLKLQFPNFADGRAYSQARMIREQLGYRGLIRASGDVLGDQLEFMQRCGFDQFEISDSEFIFLASRRNIVMPSGPLTTPVLQP